MSEITRLRLMYEDDPIVLSLIEWIEGEDDRRAALDEEIARLETDYKRQLSLRQRDLDHAKQVTETLRLREEHIAELERTMSALKAQLDRSRPNQWTTTNVKQFSATPIGSPRWVWKYEADGTFRVEEVTPPHAGHEYGGPVMGWRLGALDGGPDYRVQDGHAYLLIYRYRYSDTFRVGIFTSEINALTPVPGWETPPGIIDIMFLMEVDDVAGPAADD